MSNILKTCDQLGKSWKRAILLQFQRLKSIFTAKEKSSLKAVIQREDEKGRKIKKNRLAYKLLPRVELVDDALKPYHSEKPACETHQPCQWKDGES